MQEKILDTPYYTAGLQEGIMIVQYKPGLHIGLPEAKEAVRLRLAYYQDLKCPVLFRSSKVKSIDKAARRYLFDEGNANFTAMAFIQRTKVEKVLLRLMLSFERPHVPCRVFEDEDEAVFWLKQYKEI
jgi:hypothetical protein